MASAAESIRPERYYSVRDSDGKGTVDRAELWADLAERAWLVRRARSQRAGFSLPEAAYTTGGYVAKGSGGGFATNGDDSYAKDIAVLRVPEVGNGTDEVTVRVLLGTGGAQSINVWAEAVGPRRINGRTRIPTLIASTSSGGWFSGTVDLTGSSGYVRIYVVGSGTAGAGPAVITVCVNATADGSQVSEQTVESSWPKLSISHLSQGGRPDSVYDFFRTIQQLDFLEQRVGRPLAQHSFRDWQETSASAGTLEHRYIVNRGPSPGDVTLYVYAETAGGGTGTIEAYVTTVGGAKGAADGSVSVTAAGWYSIAILGSAFAAGENEVYLDIQGDGANATKLRAWTMEEDAYTAADYEVSGDTTATSPISSRWIRPERGDVIVGDYDGGDYSNSHRDRETLGQLALHCGRYGNQLLGGDVLVDTATPADVRRDTQAAWTSADTLARAKWTTGAGVVGVEFWVAVYRDGRTDTEVLPRVRMKRGATELSSVSVDFSTLPNEATWVRLGIAEVSELTAYEWEVLGGFIANVGGAPPSAASNDALVLQGVWWREIYSDQNPNGSGV